MMPKLTSGIDLRDRAVINGSSYIPEWATW